MRSSIWDAGWPTAMASNVALRYLVPSLAAVSQMEMASQLERLTNAAISFMRHGEGSHVNRVSGLSGVDLDNNKMRRQSAAFRAEMARKNEGNLA